MFQDKGNRSVGDGGIGSQHKCFVSVLGQKRQQDGLWQKAGWGRGCWGSRAQDVSVYIIISRSSKVPQGQFCNNIATLTTFLVEVIELDQVSDIHCRDISNCFVFGLQKFREI